MPSAKRERQREGRQVRVAAAMAEQKRRQRVRSIRNFGIIVVVIVAVIVFLAWRSGGDNKQTATASSSASSSAPAPVAITVPPAGATLTGNTPCPAADGTSARTTTFAAAPSTCIDPAKTYTASVATTKGTFSIALDAKSAPNTVNNFVVLARYHYFDGVAFHRIVKGFVDQVGDANGPTPGQGGPGYTFTDELPKDPNPYTEGAVAMANSGANTNGSQWFVVVGSGGQQLGVQYSKFGTVQSGLDVVKTINDAGGTDQAGTPLEEIKINAVTIIET